MTSDPPLSETVAARAPGATKSRIALTIAIWTAALLISFAMDARVARWMRDSGMPAWLREHEVVRQAFKTPGEFYFTLALGLVIGLKHPAKWRGAAFMLAGVSVTVLNQPIKFLVGRKRPFKVDELGQRLAPFELHPFSGPENLCFPSGHGALVFATAAALAILWPRGKWIYYAIAVVVTAERIAENAHWLSDCVAAAALGIGSVQFVAWLFRRSGWGVRGTGFQPVQSDGTS